MFVKIGFIDGVFVYMVLCMVLFISEIYVVVVEVGWVLRLGGKFIYIVWYIGDVYYGVG